MLVCVSGSNCQGAKWQPLGPSRLNIADRLAQFQAKFFGFFAVLVEALSLKSLSRLFRDFPKNLGFSEEPYRRGPSKRAEFSVSRTRPERACQAARSIGSDRPMYDCCNWRN